LGGNEKNGFGKTDSRKVTLSARGGKKGVPTNLSNVRGGDLELKQGSRAGLFWGGEKKCTFCTDVKPSEQKEVTKTTKLPAGVEQERARLVLTGRLLQTLVCARKKNYTRENSQREREGNNTNSGSGKVKIKRKRHQFQCRGFASKGRQKEKRGRTQS